jgi:hypothetical protein
MQRKAVLWIPVVALVALVLACGGDQKPASPTTPSTSAASGASAAADTVMLKVNAPALTSPVGGVRLTEAQVTLTFQAAAAKYVTGETFVYRVQLLDSASTLLEEKTGTATSYKMATQFNPDTLYRWKVRAEQQGMAGPWSVTETFRSMEKPSGYIKGTEIYDPLDDGKTVGTPVGPVTFIPGQGVRLDTNNSWIVYTLSQPLVQGEFSLLISGLDTSGGEVKNKVYAMGEGDADMTTNERRFTIEKRSNGVVAWRMITSNDQIDTVGNERVQLPFHENLWYFWKATWGGAFNLTIKENGINGSTVYNFGKGYDGVYDPSPHNVYVGCPYSPRSGPQTSPGMIVRQVWVSGNPRPSWAQ